MSDSAKSLFEALQPQAALLSPEGEIYAAGSTLATAQLEELSERFSRYGAAAGGAAGGSDTSFRISPLPDDGPWRGFWLAQAGETPALALDDRHLLHDLRGAAQMLALALAAPEASALPAAVVQAAAQMQRLLRPETATRPRYDLVAELRAFATAMAPQLGERGAQLRLILPDAPLWTRTDATPLVRVTQNLLLNAAAQGETVILTLAALSQDTAQAELRLSVTDAGSGLSPEIRRWLVGAASRPSPITKSAQHGYGLEIIRANAAALDATIETTQETGHTIHLNFPLALAPEEIAPAPAAPSLEKKTIWIAEDDATTAALLSQLIGAQGAGTRLFEDGATLLDALEVGPAPDLILIDHLLKGMTGLELAPKLQDIDPELPVLGLSGQSDPQIAARAIYAGVRMTLTKPILPKTLIAQLHEHLARDKPEVGILFDTTLLGELLDELGLRDTLSFQQRALREVVLLLERYDALDLLERRKALHSAIGATSLTGLLGVGDALRLLHQEVCSKRDDILALKLLIDTIEETKTRLDTLVAPTKNFL